MKPQLKINLEQVLSLKPVILELGCGKQKKMGAIGVDRVDLPQVDIIADIEDGLEFIPDNSIDKIYCLNCLEHISNFEKLMGEILRVMKKDANAIVEVPHFSNPYYYSDPTHKRLFGLYSFYYFVESKNQLRRKVPDYYFPFKIKILSQKITFDSPFLFGKIFKRFLQIIFNLGSSVQELYEENLCYLFPCSTLQIVFTKADMEICKS